VRKAEALGHYPFVENHHVSMPDTEESSTDESQARSDSEITQVECFSDCGLSVGVHRFRAAVGSLVMAGALLVVMAQFTGEGIRLASFSAKELDAEGQKRLLDNYNSVSGGLTALLMKPLDVFLSMVIAVGCLCVAPSFSMYHENRRRYLVMGVIGVVSYLMNTGFSALNVQAISGPIQPRISASDLAVENEVDDTQSLDTEGLVTTTWNTSFREKALGNSVRNTILRNLFIPTERVPAWSNFTLVYTEDPYKNVIASYGFPARSWQQNALPRALEPTSMSMPMGEDPGEFPLDDKLPMDGDVATNLVMYAILVSNGMLGWWGIDDEAWNFDIYENMTGSLPMAEFFNLSDSRASKTLVKDTHKTIVDYFAKTKYANTTDELAKIEFSRVNLSDSVVFDALTVEIPTKMLDVSLDNTSSSSSYFIESKCNPGGCLIEDVGEYKINENGSAKTTIYPRVQALAICLNDEGKEELIVDFKFNSSDQVLQECKQHSYSSMIIVSIGKRIEGDEFVAEECSSSSWVNARMVYSLTVGRLSWTLEDFAETNNAECGSDRGCHGIRFPLENAVNSHPGEYLLVSNASVPMNLLEPINLNDLWFKVGASKWKVLASTAEEPRQASLETDSRAALIVLPRNFKRAKSKVARMRGADLCEHFVDKYLSHIEKNHLYIEHSLQPAYTAGLYFIFQNAVVRRLLPTNVTTVTNKPSLEFSGNTQEMYVQASIPRRNVLLTVAGCVIMVSCGLSIVILGKRCETAVHEHCTAATTVEAVANLDKFPRTMMQLQLRDRVTGEVIDAPLDSLRVKTVVLVGESQEYVITESDLVDIRVSSLDREQGTSQFSRLESRNVTDAAIGTVNAGGPNAKQKEKKEGN